MKLKKWNDIEKGAKVFCIGGFGFLIGHVSGILWALYILN